MPLIEQPDNSTLREVRISKLPAWARREIHGKEREIHGKEREVEELKKRLTEITEGTKDSRIQSQPYHDHPYGLPEDAQVSFNLQGEDGDDMRERVMVNIREQHWDGKRYLDVTAGGTSVRIQPQASNCFRVYLED